MKKINMKKWMILSMLLLPIVTFGAEDTGLNDGISMLADTGKVFGIIIILVSVGLWLMPVAFAGLVYTGQKKKAEQMHEEVGLKAAILALLAGVMGAAMSYYVVGTIGAFASGDTGDTDRLKKGNKYLISRVVGAGADEMNVTK